jgi:hypothetical protein
MTDSFGAAMEALRKDSATWLEMAHATKSASSEAARLTLTEHDLSWASPSAGLLATYEEARAKTSRLLTEASVNFEHVSAALLDVAARYERSDAEASRAFAGLWEIRH